MFPQKSKINTEASNLKQLGNEAYKKGEFSTAIEYYEKGIKIDPNEITFYHNVATVHFVEENYTDCITYCEKAIERTGRKTSGGFTVIAKNFARLGEGGHSQTT